MNLYIKDSACFHVILKNTLLAIIIVGFSNVYAEKLYFKEDFEKGFIDSKANPQWSWKKAPGSGGKFSRSMMLGNTDMYFVSDTIAYSGKYSLRLNFSGRNNWCNQCGGKKVTLTQNDIDTACISITGAPWGEHLYNRTNGMSRWKIISSNDDQVCFNARIASGDSMYLSSGFSLGDEVIVPYKCGVNGIVGKRINRRSDCDKVINYLDGARATNLDYGETISRSFYLYIPSATVLPDNVLKLGYTKFKINGSLGSSVIKLDIRRKETVGSKLPVPGGVFISSSTVERDKWFYFKEVWTRETSDSAGDGKYMLYFSPANNYDPSPLRTQAKITIGRLVDMSMNGNFQHNNDASGYVYFDDILIYSYNSLLDKPAAPTGLKVN